MRIIRFIPVAFYLLYSKYYCLLYCLLTNASEIMIAFKLNWLSKNKKIKKDLKN